MGDELDRLRAEVRYQMNERRRMAERSRLMRLAGCRRRRNVPGDRSP